LTKHQREIVIGSALGDGCLAPNWSKTNYCLKITRSEKQKEYIEWQYENLKPFVLTAPHLYEPTHAYTMRTISHKEITKLHSIFYKNGKKIMPSVMVKYIKLPLVLAVWFMDDGNAVKWREKVYGYHLNTQSFTLSENKCIAEMFLDELGIQCTTQMNHGKARIYIVSKSKDRFADLIKPFVISSMRYKLG
jgi:hypothetical protein